MQALKPTKKPSKQRKMLYQAPDHKRYKFFAAPLSSALATSHKVKTLPVRSGDTVRVTRGDHKGLEGKVTQIDRRKYRIYIEGLTREKVDGTAIPVAVHPSKVVITNLALDDKWRKKILERKKGARKKAEEVVKKPLRQVKAKEVVEAEEEATKEVATGEKPKEKKPRGRKKRVAKKPPAQKVQEEKKTAKVEEKAKPKKTRAKRRTAKKTEGGA